MLETAECLVSAGPGITIKWFETHDGAICLTIRHDTSSPARIEKAADVTDNPSNTWTCSERLKKSGSNVVSFQPCGRDIEQNDVFDEQVGTLREKIEKKWHQSRWRKKRATVHENLQLWTEDPGAFFGRKKTCSSEQWSFECLHASTNKLDVDRNPFHKINLARRLNKRVRVSQQHHPGFSKGHCKKAMMKDIHPDFKKLGQKEQDYLMRNFEYLVDQGNFLWLIGSLRPGLLLTVAPLLTRDE
jgi:hypothetical protein